MITKRTYKPYPKELKEKDNSMKNNPLVIVEVTLSKKTQHIRCLKAQVAHLIKQYERNNSFQGLRVYTLH